MTDEERSKCHKIIHTAAVSAAAIGGGLAQLPGSDTVPITAIQVGMIISLGVVFGKTITKTAATSIVSGFVASYGGRALSQWLVGWIPGWGNAVNASTAFTENRQKAPSFSYVDEWRKVIYFAIISYA